MAQFQVCFAIILLIDSFISFYSGSMSTKELAFSKFTAFRSVFLSGNSIVEFKFSGMWFPDLKGYFAGPSFDFSVAENVDFSLYWQHFESKIAVLQNKN